MRLALALAAVLVIAGCGGSGGEPKGGDDRLDLTTPKAESTPAPASAPDAAPTVGKGVTRREAAVIRGWADTLRAGHVRRAARYFALPSIVANGTPPLKIRTRLQAETFNRLLVCGAKVVALKRAEAHRVLATFLLTERPGGGCGGGTGHYAHTAFRIRGGRITQWLRADDPDDGPQTSPS